MQTLTIYTCLYNKELKSFFSKHQRTQEGFSQSNLLIISESSLDDGVEYCVLLDDFDIGRFVEFMEKLVLMNNEIVKSSEKLLSVIGKMIFASKHNLLVEEFILFIDENDFLNIEGYINFVLHEYSMQINSILYSVVKKSLYL